MTSTQAESTIKFAFVVFRHGIRSPIPFSYPANPYNDYKKYYPEGEMELTKAGKKQIYDVGQIIRARYSTLLGDMYKVENVYFQSTAVERTAMSTQIMSQSIYPPKGYQIWRKSVTWHPIPVWTDYSVIDKVTLIAGSKDCPYYTKLQTEANVKVRKSDITRLYEPLSNLTGRLLNKPEDLLFLWDNLCYQDYNGLQVPQWAVQYYPSVLRNVNNLILKTWIADTPDLLSLTTGTFFHFIKTVLADKANNTLKPDRKVFVHGGHDSSLIGLLAGIGNVEPLETPPGSTVVFELHEVKQQHFVKVFYLDVLTDRKSKTFKEIQITLCDNPCTLESFLKTIKSLSPDEWKDKCSMYTNV